MQLCVRVSSFPWWYCTDKFKDAQQWDENDNKALQVIFL